MDVYVSQASTDEVSQALTLQDDGTHRIVMSNMQLQLKKRDETLIYTKKYAKSLKRNNGTQQWSAVYSSNSSCQLNASLCPSPHRFPS